MALTRCRQPAGFAPCWCIVLHGLFAAVAGLRVGVRFILISSPSTSSIYYATLPTASEQALSAKERVPRGVSVLISGLQEPQSIALFEGSAQLGATLYVADTKAQAVYGFILRRIAFDFLTVGAQMTVLQGVTASGLAADGFGNLVVSTDKGEIGMIHVEELFDLMNARSGGNGTTLVPFAGNGDKAASGAGGGAALKQPAGLAADGFFVYVANSGGDATSGTILKGPQFKEANSTGLAAIAANTDVSEATAVNLCLARDNVFFTGNTNSLYAVKTGGGSIVEVANGFKEPRGVAYDEESTVFVADEGRDLVFSLPGNFGSLRTFNDTAQVYSVKGPSGLAILASRSSISRSSAFFTASLSSLVLAAVFVAFVI